MYLRIHVSDLKRWILAGVVTVALSISIVQLASSIMCLFGKKDGAGPVTPPKGLKQVNQHVWMFHEPEGKSKRNYDVDIVFFHGLQEKGYEEAVWKTWTAKDNDRIVWPKDWLSLHLPKARIFSVSYNSSASKMTGESVQGDITLIAENLVQDIILNTPDIGQNCPVFLVGHCLGGIIIKKFILTALDKKDEMDNDDEQGDIDKVDKFLENLKGAFFYGVPSGGMQKDTFDKFRSQLEGESPILKLLTTLDLQRGRINEDFRQQRNIHNVRTFGLAEGRVTTYSRFEGVVVPEPSIRQDVDTYYTHTTADHFTVCKATGLKDFLVMKKLTSFITDVVPGLVQHVEEPVESELLR